MTTTAWAHLPNARHIDAVLADARKRPGAWDATWDATRDAAWDAAWAAARGAALTATRGAVRIAALTAAWDAARVAAWAAAQAAIAALSTWDSSADLLECTPDVLRAMIDLAEPPVCHQAALLLPYAIVRSNAKQEVT